MRTFKRVALVLFVILIWSVFIGLGFMNGFLLRPITSKNNPEAFVNTVKEKVKESLVGNLAMVLIENGEVSEDFYFATDQPVNENTSFPVASISKWVTSFGVLKLVEQGRLDLDKPVDDYLTRWHLPESEFDNSKVTVRKLLSHSSGLVDGLGYEGFAPNEAIQSLEESLTKASDSPYAEGVARVGYEPGSQYMYSGAAYTLLQLIIEEISGQTFQEYMSKVVFEPLGMDNSTFVLSDKPNLQLAQLYTYEGTIATPRTFTALAAAALYTSTSDLTKFLKANISPNPVLSLNTISEMSKPETFIGNKIGVYGLGPHLYSQNDKASNIIGHDGSGGSVGINTAARIDLISKSGIIILEMGHENLASTMADEWLFWKAGIADYTVMQRNIPYLLNVLVIGILVIISTFIFIYRNRKAPKKLTD